MVKRLLAVWCGLLLVGSIGCGESVDDDVPDGDATGMHLAVAAPDYSDVEYMEYKIYDITEEDGTCPDGHEELKKAPDESPLIWEEQRPMKKNMTLPMNDVVKASPFKEDSEHRFADLLHYTDAGCYFVYIRPERVDEEGDKDDSQDCLPTYGTVEVTSGEKKKKTGKDGYTEEVNKKGFTEKVFISQCPGLKKDQGVMDLIAALNGPPNIDDVDVIEQKFEPCEDGEAQEIKLCASASDPDNDPLEFVWSLLVKEDGTKTKIEIDLEDSDEDPVDLSQLDDYGIKEVEAIEPVESFDDCIRVKFHKTTDSARKFKFKVTVFDLLWGDAGQETFEQWFKDRNIKKKIVKDDETTKYVKIRSRDSQKLKSYVDECPDPEELACNQSFGYWRLGNPKAEETPEFKDAVNALWPDSFDAYDAQARTLCKNETYPETWISILRDRVSDQQYYNLAIAYIAAELNFAAFEWDDTTTGVASFETKMRELLDAVLAALESDTACGKKNKSLADIDNGNGKADEAIEAANDLAQKLFDEPPTITNLMGVQSLLNDVFNEHLCPGDIPIPPPE